MNFRGWFLVAVLLVPVGPLGAQEEFPIGAWFPGMTEGDDEDQWAARLDSVQAAGFNTVHAMRGRGGIRTSEYNKKWMDLAHARGLKVQLHSWQQPEDWREHSRNYWTRTFEAEDTELFTYPIGREVTDDDGTTRRVARYAATGEHNPGLLLESGSSAPSRLYLRRNPESGHYSRFGHHVFWLKTDDATGTDHIATLRVLQPSGTVMDSMEVFEDRFQAADTYQDFGLEYDIGPKTDDRGSIPVRYQVYWTGADTLWVDHIRAHDWEIDPDTEEPVKPPHAARLFAGKFDRTLTDTLAKYDGVRAPRPWRFALYDEPRWELRESVAYVDSFIKAQTGGTPGISPYNQNHRGAMERYVDTVSPPELLVDFYPIFHDTPAPGQAAYADSLRRRLDWLVTGYGYAREVSQGHGDGIPLWCVVQTHNWSNLRNPTPEEIRVQVNLALAHGATGIYYYQYHSYSEDRQVDGLVDLDYRRTPRLDAAEALNAMLDALDDTFLELTSDAVFWGDRPAVFVEALSSNDDYFLGAFTHTDGTRYLMVVNTQCGTAGTRTTTVTLNAAALKGDAYDYTLFDVYGDRRLPAGAGGSETHPEFEVTLGPGEGTLYRVDADLPVLASFGSSRYEMIEGGEAVSGENPADVGKRVEVTVSLSAAPSERLEVPMVVTALSAEDTDEERDYGVRDLSPSGGLVFTGGSASASFEIRARGDDDVEDETIVLSFGLLPAGVRAGTPSASTVTIHDTPNQPEGLTAAPGHGEVTLRWDAPDPENPNPGIRGWQYQVRLPPQQPDFGDWMPMGLEGFTDQTVFQRTEHTVQGLPNGVKHLFRIRAYTRGYGLASEKATATPNSLLAEAYWGAVVLRWIDPEGEDIARWEYQVREVLEQGQGDWGEWSSAGGESSARSHTVRGLTNGVRHHFKVRGLTAAGVTALTWPTPGRQCCAGDAEGDASPASERGHRNRRRSRRCRWPRG